MTEDQTRTLLKLLDPLDLPAPEVCLSEDNDLHFDWHDVKGSVTILLQPNGVLSWAALVKGAREGEHGSKPLSEGLSTELVRAMKFIFN